MSDFTEEEIERGKAVWAVTSGVYEEVCEELGYSKTDLRTFEQEIFDHHHRPMNPPKYTFDQLDSMKIAMDDLYCRKLRELPTEQIQEILDTYELGLHRRARKTIDMLHDELANRAIMEVDT